jgi:flagellar M-ring protein FliF
MNENIRKTVTTVKEKWTSVSLARRIIFCLLLVAVIVIVIVTVTLLTRPDYIKLYEATDEASSPEIVAAIQELGYTAEMRGDGSVYVLRGTENDIAMSLALQGFPQDTIPYDTYLNNTDMFTTESQKQELLEISMEERMSRIISTIDGIDNAIVTLEIPSRQNTVITTFRQQPTANVFIQFKPGTDRLTNRQIVGITNIVKAADSGLTEENITITDGNGIPQISTEDDSGTDIDKLIQRFNYKKTMEKDIENKINTLLAPIYGDTGFSAQVNMNLDFDSRAEESVNYSGENEDNTGVISREDSANASGSNTVDGEVAGEEPNTEEYPEGIDAGTGGNWTDNSNSVDYLVDVVRSQVVKDGYDIIGLSVSVAIYKDYLTEPQIESTRAMVGNVAGIDPTVVNDVVSVEYFAPLLLEEIAEPEEAKVFLDLTVNDLIVVGAILVILIIIAAMVMVLLSASHKRRRKEFEKKIIESGHFDLNDAAPNEIEKTLFMLNKDKPEAEIPSLLDDGVETKEIIIRKEIANFARHSPEIVAALLRNWMTMDLDEVHRQDRERPDKHNKNKDN